MADLADRGCHVEELDVTGATKTNTVLQAIQAENGYTHISRAETNVSRLDDLQNGLIRHEGNYYVLRRGHVDDISLVPLARSIATALGVVTFLICVGLGWRARA